MERALLDISYQPNSYTIIDPMYTILEYLELIHYSKNVFSGVSSLAFRFSVNKDLDFSSTFIYNWSENWLATDFIGIHSKMYSYFTDDFTYSLYQKKLLKDMKNHLDEGIPSIIWDDQFVIVKGYDDLKQELILTNGCGTYCLPYEQLGFSKIPMWCIHLFSRDQIEMDEKELFLESIFQAVYKARYHDPSLPEGQYACGLMVYDFIINWLENNNTLKKETSKTIEAFIAVKQHLCHYFLEIKPKMPELSPSLPKIECLLKIINEIENTIKNEIQPTICLFHEAKEIESSFYYDLEKIYQVEFYNRMGSFWLR